jgi:membrane protein
MLAWFKRQFWPTAMNTVSKWYEDDGGVLSAAMAYYAAFSLFPLCMVLIAALGWASRISPLLQGEQQRLLDVVAQNVNPWLAEQLGSVLAGVRMNAGLGGPIGLVTLLIGAIGLFVQFENIFDRVWGVPRAKSRGILAAMRMALFDRLMAFLMLLGVGALLLLVVLFDIVLSSLQTFVVQLSSGRLAWHAAQIGITVGLTAILFTLVYKVFPPASVRWREAASGGLLVAVILQVGQQLMSSYLIGEKYSVYGVVGSFVAIMLWIYYTSAVVFLGAEFVQEICRNCSDTAPADPKETR